MIVDTCDIIGQLTELAYSRDRRSIVVGTHDGTMHPDEICAIAILAEHLPGGIAVDVIRSRDEKLLRHADILIDVSVWPTESPFDHHGERLKYYPNGIPYSALGLILEAVEPNRALRELILLHWGYAIQAVDNGVYRLPRGIEQSKMRWINTINPTWQEHLTDAELLKRFNWAVDVTRVIYKGVRLQALAKLSSQNIIEHSPQYLGRFIELPLGGCPWQQFAYRNPNILGEYHKDNSGLWTVRVAKEQAGDATPRVTFPEEWGGKEQRELQQISGIPGAFFCHRSLYMATFKNVNDAKRAMQILSDRYDAKAASKTMKDGTEEAQPDSVEQRW